MRKKNPHMLLISDKESRVERLHQKVKPLFKISRMCSNSTSLATEYINNDSIEPSLPTITNYAETSIALTGAI